MTRTVLPSTKSLVDAHADVSAVPTVAAAPDAVDPTADAALDAVASKLVDAALGGATDDGAAAAGAPKDDEAEVDGNDDDSGGGWLIEWGVRSGGVVVYRM
jgi:hypothetical protein